MTIKILNLYAGIGGNRKLWDGDIEVTAVENVPEIAKIYQDFFPNDKVIIADAHQFLLEHYKEFDFIWSSPPCPTHSRMRKSAMKFANGSNIKAVFPDMKLYEEILFLQGYFEGKYVVENVISWYEPLIRPYTCGRHYFWSNFPIFNIKESKNNQFDYSFTKKERNEKCGFTKFSKTREERVGFNLSNKKGIDKGKVLNNCVEPEVGLHIFNMAFKDKQKELI